MNCPCCAAPIPSRGVVCTYCGHRIDVDLQGSGKSVEDYDLKTLQCPDCEIPLKSLIIASSNIANRQNLTVSRCNSCLGLFIEQNTLDNVLQAKVRQPSEIDYRLLTNLENSNRSLVKGWRYRPCPVCRTLMNRKLHGKRSGVIVDSCRDHGLWLDAGELRQLMEWSRAGGEKLDQKHRSHEKKQRTNQKYRQKIEATKQDNANKLNPSTELPRQNQQQSSATNLEDLIEIIIDLFRF